MQSPVSTSVGEHQSSTIARTTLHGHMQSCRTYLCTPSSDEYMVKRVSYSPARQGWRGIDVLFVENRHLEMLLL